MPLPLQLSSGTILTALVTDVKAAWSLSTVFTHDPDDAGGEVSARLPEAYISLESGGWDGEWASVNTDHAVMRWLIVGRFVKPSAARLHEHKEAKVNSLLALLTAGPRYHGAVWQPQGLSFDFGDADADSSRNWYAVRIRFQCEF